MKSSISLKQEEIKPKAREKIKQIKFRAGITEIGSRKQIEKKSMKSKIGS